MHLEETLQCLTWNFGAGALLSIDREHRTYTIKRTSCEPETRKYRIRGNKVFALGTRPGVQMQVKDAMPGEVVETTSGNVYKVAHPSEIIGRLPAGSDSARPRSGCMATTTAAC